jgi:prevent-host-death family protein
MDAKEEMPTISISKFKATCLAVLAQVERTGHPILVTRYGKAIARVMPPVPVERPQSWLGCMSGKARIVGDIISPAGDESEWEALLS